MFEVKNVEHALKYFDKICIKNQIVQKILENSSQTIMQSPQQQNAHDEDPIVLANRARLFYILANLQEDSSSFKDKIIHSFTYHEKLEIINAAINDLERANLMKQSDYFILCMQGLSHFRKADFLQDLKDKEKEFNSALHKYNAAIEINADNALLFSYRGLLYKKMFHSGYDYAYLIKAQKDFEHAQQLDKYYVLSSEHNSFALAELCRFNEAAEAFNIAMMRQSIREIHKIEHNSCKLFIEEIKQNLPFFNVITQSCPTDYKFFIKIHQKMKVLEPYKNHKKIEVALLEESAASAISLDNNSKEMIDLSLNLKNMDLEATQGALVRGGGVCGHCK